MPVQFQRGAKMRTKCDITTDDKDYLYFVMITQYKQGDAEDGTIFVDAKTPEKIEEYAVIERPDCPITLSIHDKCPSWDGIYAGANPTCYLSVKTAEALAKHLLAAVEAVKKNSK